MLHYVASTLFLWTIQQRQGVLRWQGSQSATMNYRALKKTRLRSVIFAVR